MEYLVLSGIAYLVYRAFTKSQSNSPPIETEEVIRPPQKQIALIGVTGSGKSSTGNALLNKQNYFAVDIAHGTTKFVQDGTYSSGYKILDTPGLLDDIDFWEAIWKPARDSEILIYVTKGQLYRQELEFIERIGKYQANYNKKLSLNEKKRFLIVYINMLDLKNNTMPTKAIETEHALVKEQVKNWVDDEYVVYGSAAPVKAGKKLDPNIGSLEKLITSILSKNT